VILIKEVSKEKFQTLYPQLIRIFNHSKKAKKYWRKTVGKFYVVDDIEYQIKTYWRHNK
jgi:hypothetical protein